jgi:GNAT superfamily N-acetyltransferase
MTSHYITIKELPDYLKTPAFQKGTVIPISRKRAMSHAKNPRAMPEDVALILIKENDQLLGYIGLLPDIIFLQNQATHFAWMSCIWVNPEARGKGVASQLLREAFSKWNGYLLATEFTASAKRLYDKLNLFDDLAIVHGVRAYLRLNLAVLLPKKNPSLAKIRFLLKIIDAGFNFLNEMRLFFYKKKSSTIQVEQINEIDQESWKWIERFQKKELFRRTQNDLNWILKNPWLSNDLEAKEDASRYHFSIYSKHFAFSPLKIYLKNELVGLIILSIRGDAVKVPYAYFKTKHTATIAKVIEDYMLQNKCSILTIYNKQLVDYFAENRSLFFMIRPFNRHYLIAKALHWGQQKTDATIIQDGDGDCAFT